MTKSYLKITAKSAVLVLKKSDFFNQLIQKFVISQQKNFEMQSS